MAASFCGVGLLLKLYTTDGWAMGRQVTMSLSRRPNTPQDSNMTKEQYMAAVEATKEYIQAGDIFQLVLSQRFRRRTFADPFEVYRCACALHI